MEPGEREQIKELLTGLSYLLSFATSSDVAFYGYSHEEEPRVNERKRQSWPRQASPIRRSILGAAGRFGSTGSGAGRDTGGSRSAGNCGWP